MRKMWFFVPVVLLLAAMLGACGGGEVDLSNTIDAPDGSISIDTPDSWSYYGTDPENGIVLSLSNNDTAYANISYYPASDGYDMEFCLSSIKDYYGDNIIGDVEDTEAGDHDASYFEYSMVDIGEDGSEYNYHGYEYVVDFGTGIVEVDIFYSQGTLEGKIFSPSKSELELLRLIAVTVQSNI